MVWRWCLCILGHVIHNLQERYLCNHNTSVFLVFGSEVWVLSSLRCLSHLSLGSLCTVELEGFFTRVQNKITALRSQLLMCIRFQHYSVLEFGPYSLLSVQLSVSITLARAWTQTWGKPMVNQALYCWKNPLIPVLQGWASLFSIKKICSWTSRSVLQMQFPHFRECMSYYHWKSCLRNLLRFNLWVQSYLICDHCLQNRRSSNTRTTHMKINTVISHINSE